MALWGSGVRLSSAPPAFARATASREGCHAEAESGGGPVIKDGTGYGPASQLMGDTSDFFYVYMLESLSNPERHYVGLTRNLKSRLRKHNEGGVPHTSKHRPWRIKTALAFTDKERALEFERYLKSASGRAFASKRL